MKVEDNHYKYRIETKDSNGSVIDFVDIDTVEPLRCAYDVQDELNLETNEHIKRVEEIILNADSTEFWYVDEDRSTDTHLVCYFEEVQLMANANHPMVDTDRSLFEYGKINTNEYQDTNFICTHVMPNGVSRIYMSIDKDQLLYQVFTNETIKEYIAQNPITIWYAIRYPVAIPRSMSKGHLLTLDGQTDVSISTNGKEVGLPLVKFNIGETEYNVDNKTLSIKNTTEGTQIRNIVLEGNTPINYARGNGVNTTEQVSNTRYDFAPFYDGQATIQGTVEGGYVSAKLYGDTMVNIAKPYGETPLLTATNESTLCDDLLGTNVEGIVLADGEITEGRIYGDSLVNIMVDTSIIRPINPVSSQNSVMVGEVECWLLAGTNLYALNLAQNIKPNTTYTIKALTGASSVNNTRWDMYSYNGSTYTRIVIGNSLDIPVDGTLKEVVLTITTPSDIVKLTLDASSGTYFAKGKFIIVEGEYTEQEMEAISYFNGIGSVANPCTIFLNNNFTDKNLFNKDTATVGYTLNTSTGEPNVVNSYYSTSDFIFVAEGYNYRVANDNCSEMCFYDLNKNFISSISRSFTPTQNGYIRFVYSNSNINKVMFGSFSSTNPTYTEYQQLDMQQATFPYTLNKLPNGVVDYIDVVNKVHVQRVGVDVINGSDSENWILYNRDYTDWTTHQWRGVLSNKAKAFDVISRSSSSLCDKLNFGTIADGILEDYEHYRGSGKSSTGNSDYLYIWLDKTKATDINSLKTYLQSNPITVLYELETPIYTPLTDEEIAQLPLSAYADGYVMLSSDQLTPSFEFRMRASNRYQVDMLETGYYYLNAPVGNVKLGTANVDVQQMPCIIKVDNVGTGDSGYRLTTSATGGFNITIPESDMNVGGYFSSTDGAYVQNSNMCYSSIYYEISPNTTYGILSPMNMRIQLHTENQSFIKTIAQNNAYIYFTTTSDTKYFRISYHVNTKKDHTLIANPITLAKLPSHRIPTSFTQGMKCGNDFGYWEGIKESVFNRLWSTDSNWGMYDDIKLSSEVKLNRIEYGNTIVEDEFDIATGKFTKRVGKYTINGNSNLWAYDISKTETSTHMSFCCSQIPNFKKGGRCIGFLGLNYGAVNSTNSYECWNNLGVSNNLYFRFRKDRYSYYGDGVDGVKAYFNANPTTIYYELEVPEISYLTLTKNIVKMSTNSKSIQINKFNEYLTPQCKPSHLTYPVPSLVGNRTYTVVHNRKNITGSTKPIELNLGGTVVQLNDASSKTLVKTPSTLAHSNLIFIGGESTVDHIMVLDGDWTNKPIEYFENMMGHDTDAIITIIGNGQIDDVEEQYLW